MDNLKTAKLSVRTAGVLLAALLTALVGIVALARVDNRDAAAYPAGTTATDNSGPAEFLPAPNPAPICASQTYFGPYSLNAAVAAGTAPRQTVWTDMSKSADDGTGPTTTFTTTAIGINQGITSPEVFPGPGNSIGITMYQPAAANVSLSEPMFYSQWVFTDLDQDLEGFEVRPVWTTGTGELGIYFPDTEWNFAGSNSNFADFNTTSGPNNNGYDLLGRTQVDFYGPVNGFNILRTGLGGSGYGGGGGCEPLGVAKQATTPIFDPATNTFTVDYTIAVNNNLPSTATLEAVIAAAQANTPLSFVSGGGTGIDIEQLQVTDALDLTGFSGATVSNLTSPTLAVNPAYDGVNDTNLFLGTDTLVPESFATASFTVTYAADFTNAEWQGCAANRLNQALGSGIAATVAVSDQSDNGPDASPAAVNEEGTGSDDPTPIQFAVDCGISLTKTVSNGPINNGDGTYNVQYTLVAENTGTGPLTNVVIDDDLDTAFGSALTSSTVASDTCTGITLAVGDTCTKVVDVVVTPSSSFSWENVATVTAVGPGGDPITNTSTATTEVVEEPAITLLKQASNGPVNNGDGTYTVEYTLTAQNTGNTLLNNIVITDDLAAVYGANLTSSSVVSDSCVGTSLRASVPPGSGDTCVQILSVVFTPGANLGPYNNSATVTGVSPGGVETTATSDSSVTAPDQNPAISLVKTASTGELSVGVVVGYSFLVTNTGDVVLNNVVLTDDLLTNESCPATTLAVGASMTCTGTYTITQADVDAGTVLNTASVDGTSPAGQTVTATDSVTYPIEQTPGLSLVKAAAVTDTNADGLTNAGDVINYTMTVVNTGNITQTGIVLTDDLTADETCPKTTLAPGESMECTATYTITPEDVAAGQVDNTATVNSEQESTATDDATVPTEETPAITLVKTASTGDLAVGVVVEYTFAVTNSGDVPLDPVVLDDPLLTNESCPQLSLAVGASMNCTGTYTITQADVDAGTVDNTAVVTGISPAGETVSSTDSVTYPIPQNPGLTLVKTAAVTDQNGDAINNAGDLINYTFTVTNNGNVTQTGVVLTDDLTADETCPKDTLAPGESMDCTATYVITPEDVAAGSVDNVATVKSDQDSTATDNETVPAIETPGIALEKTASTGELVLGVVVTYTFEVTNVGDVPLENVVLIDDLVDDETCPATTLAVGAVMTCTGTHTITQADIDYGSVLNTAAVTGVSPAGETVSSDDELTYPLTQTPGLMLVKDSDVVDQNGDGKNNAGDLVNYTFTVTNTGNVTQTGIVLDDPLTLDETCPKDTLAPGESMECVATYVITAEDVEAGGVSNTATVNSNESTSETDNETTPTEASPAIDLVKTAATGDLALGVVVEYTFDVTNVGDVSLTNVVVEDPLITDVTCPQTTLAVNETMSCTGTHTITQADVDAGTVENTATATGTDPFGEVVSSTDTVTYPIPQDPALVVDKQDPVGPVAVGNLISYPITITNTGDVTLTSIKVVDSLTTDVVCDADVLAPGESTNCVAEYIVTQADVDACVIINTVNVAGADPNGTTISGEDTIMTSVDCTPAIMVTKDPIDITLVSVGDTVNYDIVVTNTGLSTLKSVTIDDPLTDDETCPKDVLAPGESMNCSASYVVTQADIDRGSLTNVVTATGVDPQGKTVTDDDSVTTPGNPQPSLQIDKRPPSGKLVAGETLTYPIVVTNDGNVTLTELVVTDSLSTNVTCDVNVLAPGDVANCTATYVVTDNDVNVGQIVNTATANAKDPTGETVTDADDQTVVVPKPPKDVIIVKPPPIKPPPPPIKPTLVPPPMKPTPVPAKPPLALTGTNAAPVALGGIAMIVIGSVFVLSTRRRRTR